MESYTDLLTRRVFGPADEVKANKEAFAESRVLFRLDREFNDTSGFLVFRFVSEIYQEFGRVIDPVIIKDGCVFVKTVFESQKDIHGVDFRDLMFSSPRYQEIFRSFGVDRVYFQGWIGANHFLKSYEIDSSGRPQPLLAPSAP